MTLQLWTLVAALAFAFLDVFAMLLWQWRNNDAYSHGFVIPFIAAYMAKRALESDRARVYTPAPVSGSVLVALGVTLLLVGRLVRVVSVTQLSLLPVLAGLVLLVVGMRGLRVLLFPIAYLSLMMPAWEIFTERLHLPFQLMSANVGAEMARAVGVPVYREDVYLVLPNITLQVAKVCSGVNYLIAVVAVCLPVAWLTLRRMWQRVALLAFALLVAVAANWVRVALIAALVHRGYDGALHGPGHVLQGLSVALVGYVAIFAGATFLARFNGPKAAGSGPSAAHLWRPSIQTVSVLSVIPAAALLIGAGLARYTPPHVSHVPPQLLAAAPPPSGAWSIAAPPPVPGFQDASTDGDVVRAYQDRSGLRAVVRLSPYGYRGAGRSAYWTDRLESEARTTAWPGAEGRRARRAIIEDGGDQWLVVYWFETAFGTTENRFLAKISQAVGPWLGQPDAVVYVIAAPVTSREGDPSIERRLFALADVLLGRAAPQRVER